MPYIAEAQLFENQVVISDTTNGSVTSGALVVKGGISTNSSEVTGSMFVNMIDITPNSNDIVHEIQHILSNNVAVFTDIPDFYFDNTVTGSFKALVSITVSKGISEYAVWELYGVQNSSGWTLTSSFTGDTIDITFRIYNDVANNRGSVQYINGNVSGTTTIKFRAVTTHPPGSYSSDSLAIIDHTKGSYIPDTLIFANTKSTIASSDIKYTSNVLKIGGTSRVVCENTSSFTNFSNGGAITSMGDVSISKNLIVGSKISIANTTPSYTLDVTGDINFTGTLYQNGNPYSNSVWSSHGTDVFYTAGNVGLGTTSPQYLLDVSGIVRSNDITSTNITTNSLISSTANITNTISTNITVNSLLVTDSKFTNATMSSVVASNIDITNITTNSFISDIGNFTNLNTTNITSGSIQNTNFNITNSSIASILIDNLNATSVTSASFIGDINITNNSIGTLLATDLSITSLTTGSINGSFGDLTNINSTNINSNSIINTDSNLTNSTISSIVFTNINTNNLTSGSFKVNNINITNFTTSTLLFTNGHGDNITTTSFDGSNGFISNINSTNITSNSLRITNGSFTNVSIGSGALTNIKSNSVSSGSFVGTLANITNIANSQANANFATGTNSNITNSTISSTTLTNLTSTNITSSSFIGTNANFTSNTFSSLAATNISSTSVTTSSFIGNNASLTNSTFASVLFSNALTNNITSGSFDGTNLNLTNINSTNISFGSLHITNGNFTNSTISSINATNINSTTVSSGSFSSLNTNMTNVTTATHYVTAGGGFRFTSGNYQIGAFYASSYLGMDIRNTLAEQDAYFNFGGNNPNTTLINIYRGNNATDEYAKIGFVNNRIVFQGDGSLKDINFGTASIVSALSVNTSGNVGINAVSTSSEKLYVNGTAKFNSTTTFGNFYSGSGTLGNNLIPSTDITYDLGSPSLKWRSVYLSGNTIYLGDKPLTLSGSAFTLEKINSTSTTNSTSTASGSVIVSGGVGVDKDLNLGENLYVTGNLTVSGTTNSLNTNTITIKDNLFILNSGPAGLADGGILVKRFESGTTGSVNYAGMFYKEASDEYVFAMTSSDPGTSPITINSYIPLRLGGISIENTTNATGVGTGGSFNVPGGASIVKNCYIGGNLTANGNIKAASDVRLKDNIQTIKNPLEKIENLRAVTYNKKDSNKKEIGFIAQELENVYPELVKTNDDGYKSVAYGNMSAVLLECIKELENEINEIKLRLI